MSNKFIERAALEMLQEQELLLLKGGATTSNQEGSNIAAYCRNTNCAGANCVKGCGTELQTDIPVN